MQIKFSMFVAALIIAFIAGYYLSFNQSRVELRNYRKRLDETTFNLAKARSAQQDAIRRVECLQNELDAATKRVNDLQARVDGIGTTAASIGDGIESAVRGVNECKHIIIESITILQRIQAGGGSEDP